MIREVDNSFARKMLALLEKIEWTDSGYCCVCHSKKHQHTCLLVTTQRKLQLLLPKETQDIYLELQKYKHTLVLYNMEVCMLLGWMEDEEDRWYRLYNLGRGIFYVSMVLPLTYLKVEMEESAYESLLIQWLERYYLNQDRFPHWRIPNEFLPDIIREFCEKYRGS